MMGLEGRVEEGVGVGRIQSVGTRINIVWGVKNVNNIGRVCQSNRGGIGRGFLGMGFFGMGFLRRVSFWDIHWSSS